MNPSHSSLYQQDQDYLVHPWSVWSQNGQSNNLIIESADGAYVTDVEGNRYLDATGGLWTANIGYGREDMAEAIAAQVRKLNHFPIFGDVSTVPSVELSQRLAELAPASVNKVFYTTTGTASNDSAVRMAHHYFVMRGMPEKKHIITRGDGYHGMSYLTASMSGQQPVRDGAFQYVRDTIHCVTSPDAYRRPEGLSLEQFSDYLVEEFEQKVLAVGPEKIACFVNEPVVGAGGVHVPPPGYTQRVYALCKKYDILFIADEVITAFGRLGGMFAAPEVSDVVPDLTCCAKGITSGYVPLGAVMVADHVFETIAQCGNNSPFAHGFTYTGHAVACAAAIKNLDILRDEKIPQRIQELGPYFVERIESLKDEPLVGDARGKGFMIAVEYVQNKQDKSLLPAEAKFAERMSREIRKTGVLVRPLKNFALISPPLTLTREEIDTIVESLRQAGRKVADELVRDGFQIG
jgi:adenosylmethionine-8-amino-7-oxononanoate aminotransferase